MKKKLIATFVSLSALTANAHANEGTNALKHGDKTFSSAFVTKGKSQANTKQDVLQKRIDKIVYNASGYHPKNIESIGGGLYIASIPFPQENKGEEHFITIFVYPEKDLVIFGDGIIARDNEERVPLFAKDSESLVALSVSDAIQKTVKEMTGMGNVAKKASGDLKQKGSANNYRDKVLKMMGLKETEVIPVKDGKEGYSLIIVDSDCPWSRKMLQMIKKEWDNIRNKVDIVAIPAVGDGVIDALSYEVWKKYQDGEKAFDILLDDGVMKKQVDEEAIKKIVEIMDKVAQNGVKQTPTIINIRPDGNIKVIEDYRNEEEVKKALGISSK